MCVVPHKQIYHCFSCGAGGDAIEFVKNYHKMTFPEALEFLAERANIKLTPWKPSGGARVSGGPSGSGGEWAGDGSEGSDGHGTGPTSRADLLNANQTASAFFRTILNHAEHGAAARAIIEKRAISAQMVESFGVGASPDRWDGLLLTIQNKGLSPGIFREAGLLKPRDSGGLYDAFRNRLMFPITDQIGRVIAFGGRRINDDDDPKYLNSPESRVFNKSQTLYGLFQASAELRRTRVAIITEGYMDTIACHQAGVTNALATLGTALTVENARILKRLCDTVVLLFDGDTAGIKAAERAVEVFFAEPIDVRIAALSSATDAKDPDELLKREGGRETLDLVIKNAIDPLELLFKGVRANLASKGGGVSAKSRVMDEFLQRVVDLGLSRVDPIRRQLIVKRLAGLGGLDWETINTALAQRQARSRPRASYVGDQAATGGTSTEAHATRASQASHSGTPVDLRAMTASEHVLGCILCEPTLLLALTDEQWAILDPETFARPASRAIAHAVHELYVNEESCSLQRVLAELNDSAAHQCATTLCMQVDRATEHKAELLREHFRERVTQALRERRPTAEVEPKALDAVIDDRSVAAATPSLSAAASASAAVADEWALSVARLRERAQALGADPRALPRPGT
jgi:DNA primase